MGFLPGCGALILLVVGFMSYIRAIQLLDYLKIHHAKTWNELTRGGKLYLDNVSVIKFSFSSENFQDPKLEKLKSKNRGMVYLLFSGFAILVGLMFFSELMSS